MKKFFCLLPCLLGMLLVAARAETIYVSNYLGSDIEALTLSGTNLGHFANPHYPTWMTRDGSGNIYVVQHGSLYIEKYSSSGARVRQLAFAHKSIDNILGPIACDTSGNLFVVNWGTGVLEKFSPSGTDLGTASYTGIANSTGMTSDAYGNIYVANTTGIEKFSLEKDEGEIIGGVFQVDGMVCDGAGNLYLNIPGDNKIEVYSASGSDLGTFAYTTFDATGLAFDSKGYLYATNPGNSTIEKFSPSGTDLGVLAGSGMNVPMAIAIGLSHQEVNTEFAAQAGAFVSLFGNGSDSASITLSRTGSFIGELFMSGTHYGLRGAFDSKGNYAGVVGKQRLPVDFQIDLQNSQSAMGNYWFSGSANGVTLAAIHATYANGQVPQESGKYTATLTLSGTLAGGPAGPGSAKLTVAKGGRAVIVGKLPDGRAFSASSRLVGSSGGKQFVIYQPLNYPSVTTRGAKGLLAGILNFEKVGSSDFEGTLIWIKPQQSKGAFPSAININLNVLGSQ